MIAAFLLTAGTTTAAAAFESSLSSSSNGSNNHGRLMAITPTILIGTGFWTVMHGFQAGKARTKYAELAKKDGEEDVEERYMLPNLYAQGTSPHVKAFNCIQRSHQQILETFTTAAMSGLVGTLVFPVTSGISTMIYSVGRYYLSKGYAECEDGDSAKRYKYPLAKGMWYGLLGNIMLGMGACVLVACGKKKF